MKSATPTKQVGRFFFASVSFARAKEMKAPGKAQRDLSIFAVIQNSIRNQPQLKTSVRLRVFQY
ncbi:hypothetical protein [Motiliproteus coralliicola]|uniref:hypothetical protein n=1 Tax=Motiliproteus coralliicola TaxID=2283196 RepID=UPI0010585EF3|nr:hypothetical protein [Motiliproteus coralliicola]